MRNLPPLNALKAFEASGRTLNFRIAAEELGVTQGAVAQQVRGLETLLKVKLFDRQARGLSLTDEGRRYLPSVKRAFELISEATENLTPLGKVVTISSTPSFATRWLVPRLGKLSSDIPDLGIRIDASNRLANFQSDGVDIAIRLGNPPFGPGLDANLLTTTELVVVCHPDLITAGLNSPYDLVKFTLLEDSHGLWPLALEEAFGDGITPEMNTMQFNQTSLAIDAAIAGQGVALTHRALVEADLADNRLQQPFSSSISGRQGFYVVAPRQARKNDAANAVRQWLMSQGSHS